MAERKQETATQELNDLRDDIKFDAMIFIYNFADSIGANLAPIEQFCEAFRECDKEPVSKFVAHYYPLIIGHEAEFFSRHNISEIDLLSAPDSRLEELYADKIIRSIARYKINVAIKHIEFFLRPENRMDPETAICIPLFSDSIRLIFAGKLDEAQDLSSDLYKNLDRPLLHEK